MGQGVGIQGVTTIGELYVCNPIQGKDLGTLHRALLPHCNPIQGKALHDFTKATTTCNKIHDTRIKVQDVINCQYLDSSILYLVVLVQ